MKHILLPMYWVCCIELEQSLNSDPTRQTNVDCLGANEYLCSGLRKSEDVPWSQTDLS